MSRTKLKLIATADHDTPHYRHGDLELQLQPFDNDITIVLPSGHSLLLQYRPESESVDVFFGEGQRVIVGLFKDQRLTPIKKLKNGNARCSQILICMPTKKKK